MDAERRARIYASLVWIKSAQFILSSHKRSHNSQIREESIKDLTVNISTGNYCSQVLKRIDITHFDLQAIPALHLEEPKILRTSKQGFYISKASRQQNEYQAGISTIQ
ncbi:hypothetical protein RRG08_026294 [Elysia crispata]|uniref:Uncharacterized protein n=1 Tax=Elysia crispata TaxID=231223 RepID=A0AAE1DCN5_9GAST|nr:hypothetical protein RRG08_026294 [Elysia crispata]